MPFAAPVRQFPAAIPAEVSSGIGQSHRIKQVTVGQQKSSEAMLSAYTNLQTYSAVFIVEGTTRKMTYEARDLAEAKALASKWGAAVMGEVAAPGEVAAILPQAYPWREAASQLVSTEWPQLLLRLAGRNTPQSSVLELLHL